MVGPHHEAPYRVPPYTEFKIEGIKQLEEVQVALAKRGLKDPWLRNEAWRYHRGFGTRGQRARALFTRGMPLGLAIAGTLFVFDLVTGGGGHGHGDGHH